MSKVHSNTTFKPYYSNQTIDTNGSNNITFYNQGNVMCLINGTLKIPPGLSITNAQPSIDVIDVTNYNISFDLNDPLTTGTDQNLLVITTKIKVL